MFWSQPPTVFENICRRTLKTQSSILPCNVQKETHDELVFSGDTTHAELHRTDRLAGFMENRSSVIILSFCFLLEESGSQQPPAHLHHIQPQAQLGPR